MTDVFIKGLERAIARSKKVKQHFVIDKPIQASATKEVSGDFYEAYRIRIITQTINYINKQKEIINDRN